MIEPRDNTKQSLRVLVTGANGCVGKAIASHLLKEGMVVSATGRTRQNAEGLPGYFTSDVTVPDSMTDSLSGVDVVVHAAGLAHLFDKGRSEKGRFMEINAGGTESVARAALKAGVGHFILISSVSVYGEHGKGVCDENSPCQPTEPYGVSKFEAERRAIEMFRGTDTCVTILRLATVYGEGDRGNVSRLISTINRNRFVWIGRGQNLKSLIHCADVARACSLVLVSPCDGINAYNVSAPPHTMREIVEAIAEALARPVPRLRVPPRTALVAASLLQFLAGRDSKIGGLKSTIEKWLSDDAYDWHKFEARFRFVPEVDLREGLKREVAWLNQSAPKQV